jgi:hypothetical protein
MPDNEKIRKSVKITVNDQIPISSNSGIEVDAVELSRGNIIL